ncbi:hypothetical protein [Actibacterium mucosum]|uniref:hypothetical protein n=1 Tax=Actibacterium mucosum TaxID=1087332 RepID=UPI0009DD5745|nr:hypothetical protein [Actibacterium mucosum]
MMRVFFVLLLMAAPGLADVTSPSGKTVDCYCTDTAGGRVELGQSICLYVDGRAFMARCEMSLNNPMWRPTGDGCLNSGLPQSLQPVLDSVPVNAQI